MDKEKIKYYLLVFMSDFDKQTVDTVLNLNNVSYCSIVYKPTYLYPFNDFLEYVKEAPKKYRWKIHNMVRDIDDGETIDSILDMNYTQSGANHLLVSKKPSILCNEVIDRCCDIILDAKYSSDLFGAISSNNPYDIFITQFSVYLANEKNRDVDILSKIKELDRKIYEI